ncbi:hypothetical protein, partial [Pantoea sp. ANP04]|uniref:hypothetical protein n=1 Tax=Pantoea sp. ANP04 TaxID=3064896 RepID=UPI0035C5B6E5
ISKDGGNTFGNIKFKNLGEVGQYAKRVRFFNLGRIRLGVVRVTFSNPTDFVMSSCNMIAESEA